MERYDYVKVYGDSHGVRFFCTDPVEIKLVTSQLEEYFPKKSSYERRLPSGEVYYCEIKGLSNRDYDVVWWIMQCLGSRGWVPLGAVGDVHGPNSGSTTTDFHYQFRRRS